MWHRKVKQRHLYFITRHKVESAGTETERVSAGRVTTNEVENATQIDKITDEEMKVVEKKWSL